MSREVYGLLIGSVTFLAFLLPPEMFLTATVLLSLAMAKEIDQTLSLKGVFPSSGIVLVGTYLSLPLGLLLATVLSFLKAKLSKDIRDLSLTFFFLVYTGLIPAFLVFVREQGLFPSLALLLGVWAHDVVALYVGRRFGKRPLTDLSPSKTVEGFFAGVLASTLVVSVLLSFSGFETLKSFALGVGVALGSAWGDLLESLIKRSIGIKDFGNALGDHGGFTDRFDSLIVAGLVFYLLSSIAQ